MYTAVSAHMLLRLPTFFICIHISKAFGGHVILSAWLQAPVALTEMFFIAWACPLFSLGKAGTKPLTILESSDLLSNSSPKFPFTVLLH